MRFPRPSTRGKIHSPTTLSTVSEDQAFGSRSIESSDNSLDAHRDTNGHADPCWVIRAHQSTRRNEERTLGHILAITAMVGPPTYPAPIQQIFSSQSSLMMLFLEMIVTTTRIRSSCEPNSNNTASSNTQHERTTRLKSSLQELLMLTRMMGHERGMTFDSRVR